MNDTAEQVESGEATQTKTTIRPDLNRYVRAKSGSGKRTHRTDDFVARTLDGKDLEAVKSGAAQLGIDVAKWEHLNPGQQRMLIGNKLRHLMQVAKDPLSAEAVTAVYGEPVAEYDEEAAKAAAEAAAAAKAEEGEVPAKPKRAAKKPAKVETE